MKFASSEASGIGDQVVVFETRMTGLADSLADSVDGMVFVSS